MKTFEEPWYWFTNTTIATLSTIILILLCIYHSYKVLIDLCTKNNVTMSPDRYKIYKLASIFTITVMVLFSIVMFLTSIISWSFVYKHCLILTTLSTLLYAYSKVIMYLVFLMRLDIVYANTICEYPRKYLIISGIITILYITILSIFHIFTYSVHPYIYHHIHLPAIKCNSIYNKYVIMVLGAYDIIASICFLIAFVRPLHCLLTTHATQQHNSQPKTIQQESKNQNFTNDILILGFKATILTASACLSTILLLVFILVSPIGNIFVGIDAIINVVSLMLMTTYYRENKYFGILCCCMIKLCKTSIIRDHEQWNKFKNEMSIQTAQTEKNRQNSVITTNDLSKQIKSITVTNPDGITIVLQ
eukprot:213321_1